MRKILIVAFIGLLVYSRFIGLDWGLPYPMHPDERNITLSIIQLTCNTSDFSLSTTWLKTCFNPNFFAYGQPTIYGAYALSKVWMFMYGRLSDTISFVTATMALRFISAISSLINVFVLHKIVQVIYAEKIRKDKKFADMLLIGLPILAFSPYFIQFSHFGTTESVLMLLYSTLIYYSLRLSHIKKDKKENIKLILFTGVLLGVSLAVKISSLVFFGLPIIALLSSHLKIRKKLFWSFVMCAVAILIGIAFSPQSVLQWKDFMGSMSYETGVGRGTYKAFYTRQFEFTVPFVFQTFKVFPYILGVVQFILAVCGIFVLSWKKKSLNILRIAFFIFLVPTAFLYAKWTRFEAPIFPIMSLFALVMLIEFCNDFFAPLKYMQKLSIYALMVLIVCIPGIAYIHIYQQPDVRFRASEWIYTNIPEGSKILSETANVVDIPMQSNLSAGPKPSFNIISFDFYHLDEDTKLQDDLKNFETSADYVFIPSRRLFTNHTCIGPLSWRQRFDDTLSFDSARCDRLEEMYPALNVYYRNLFASNSSYKQIAEFTSYPTISLFGKNIFVFPDEHAEETWTVFDHPVIRIYKRK